MKKRLAANRRNALKSTGPRTDQGKAISRMNALAHGLNRPIAPQIVHDEMKPFIEDMICELDLAADMAFEVATQVWLLRRVRDLKARRLDEIEAAAESYLDDFVAFKAALHRFSILDVYERKARSRLSRRLRTFGLCGRAHGFGKTNPKSIMWPALI